MKCSDVRFRKIFIVLNFFYPKNEPYRMGVFQFVEKFKTKKQISPDRLPTTHGNVIETRKSAVLVCSCESRGSKKKKKPENNKVPTPAVSIRTSA